MEQIFIKKMGDLRTRKGQLIQEIQKINRKMKAINCDHNFPSGKNAIIDNKCRICGESLICKGCRTPIIENNFRNKQGYCDNCYEGTIYSRWE